MNNYQFLKYLAVSIFITIGVSACSSRDNENLSGEDSKDGTSLSINIAGIEDYSNITPVASTSNLRGTNNAVIAKEKMHFLKGYDVLANAEVQKPAVDRLASNTVASSGSVTTGAIAAAPMASGIKYRLFIYDTADTNHTAPIVDVVLTSNSAPATPIQIDAGKNYEWIAFSTNETSLPNLNNGIVDKDGLKNKDVLLAKGTLLTQYGTNNLNIVFSRKTARITLSIHSHGLFGSMDNYSPAQVLQNGNAANNMLKYGDLNIFTGNYDNISTYTYADITPQSYTSGASKVYTAYTVDTNTIVPPNSLQLTMNTFTITKGDYFDKNNISVTLPANTITLNNLAFTTRHGSSYNLTLRLVESGVSVGGVIWARENLKGYDSRLGGGGNYFVADNSNSWPSAIWSDGIYYYNSNNFGVGKEKCKAVFPAGTWRLPTRAEFERLDPKLLNPASVTQYKTANSPKSLGGYAGLEYNIDSPLNTAFPLRSQKLFLPVLGAYGITKGSANPNMRGAYWTWDPATSTLGKMILTVNYNGNTDPQVAWDGYSSDTSGTNSIRCVRN